MSEQDREQAFVASGGVEPSDSAAHAPEASAASTRSRRSMLDVRPFDWSLYLPWFNRHRPFGGVHLTHWGYECYGGKSRRRYHVMLMAGRLFMDRSRVLSFDFCGRWGL